MALLVIENYSGIAQVSVLRSHRQILSPFCSLVVSPLASSEH